MVEYGVMDSCCLFIIILYIIIWTYGDAEYILHIIYYVSILTATCSATFENE